MVEVKKVGYHEYEEEIRKIRTTVFIKEQEVPIEEEFDKYETESVHFLAYIDNEAVGTCRWRKVVQKIKLERFAVLKEHRESGVGSALLKAVEEDILKQKEEGEALSLYLHAQLQALGFYEQFNYSMIGDEFFEAGIPHYKMEKQL